MSDQQSELPGPATESLLADLATRALWHIFGVLTTAVGMVAAMSLAKGNDWLTIVPDWAWLLMTIAGFAGTVRYVRWYRS